MSVFGIEIDRSSVCMFTPGMTKQQALDQLVNVAAKTKFVKDAEALRLAVHKREQEKGSTGIGGGVGIPHVFIEGVTKPVLAVGVSTAGLEFDAVDKQPVRIVILFAMPKDSNKLYLGLLAQIMAALKTAGFADRLTACNSPDEIFAVLNESGG